MNHEKLKNVPLLVFANKQDKEGAASATEITEKLRIREFCEIEKNKREWHVQNCSAVSVNGLSEGLDWLTKILKERKR